MILSPKPDPAPDTVLYRVRRFTPLFRLYTLTDGRRVWGERVRVIERRWSRFVCGTGVSGASYEQGWELAEAVLDSEPITCPCGSARHKPRIYGPTPCL